MLIQTLTQDLSSVHSSLDLSNLVVGQEIDLLKTSY